MSKKNKSYKKKREQREESSIGIKLLNAAIVIVVVAILACGAFYFGYSIFNGEPVSEEDPQTITIVVEEGDSVDGIISELESEGIISSKLIMKIQNKFFNYGLAVGTYEVSSDMTSLEILSWISTSEHSIVSVDETEAAE